MTIRKYSLGPSLITVLLLGALSGCGDGDSGNASTGNGTAQGASAGSEDTDTTVSVQIDATAGGFGASPDDPANKYAYLNLDTGEVVELSDAEAVSDDTWDIAFKRSSIKLNGGVSGPGAVQGAVADTQDDFYDGNGDPNVSVFLNASADSELTAFDAVSSAEGLSFATDRNIASVTGDGSSGSWWAYDPVTHTVSANPDNWWLVRSAGGDSYARFHVTDIVQASRDITLEMFIQGVADSAFLTSAVTWTAAIGADGGSSCFDIDAAAEVDCASAATVWDIKVEISADGRAWSIWTNGGVSGDGDGGAFGVIAAADIGDYTSGTMTASGSDISSHYTADGAGGLFEDNAWYAYNLEGNHKLWPNYRVYVIDTGADRYKLQVLSYYDEAGASAHITLRYVPLPAS